MKDHEVIVYLIKEGEDGDRVLSVFFHDLSRRISQIEKHQVKQQANAAKTQPSTTKPAFSTAATTAIRNNTDEAASSKDYKKPEKAKPQQTEKPKTSSRGNLIKRIGDTASIYKSQADKTLLASWTVTNITLDAPCVPAYEGAETSPANGHFVVLDITVETTSDFDSDSYGPLGLGAPGYWTYIQNDGTQWNGNLDGTSSKITTYTCLPENQRLPQIIGQGVKAQGKVLFDLPSTDGYLVYGNESGHGWEYPLAGHASA